MKHLFEVLGIVLVALVIGVGSAVWVIDSFPRTKMIRDRAWTSSPLVGSVQADMYLRATIARVGLFALGRTEAIYYNAFTDETGDPLRAECDYVIEGGDLPARWWSITAYDEEHFLIPNALNLYSYNMKNIRRDGAGSLQNPSLPNPQRGELAARSQARKDVPHPQGLQPGAGPT